jgi:hypothetical protein
LPIPGTRCSSFSAGSANYGRGTTSDLTWEQ